MDRYQRHDHSKGYFPKPKATLKLFFNVAVCCGTATVVAITIKVIMSLFL